MMYIVELRFTEKAQCLPPIPVLYDSLSITVAGFSEGSPLQMIFITLVNNHLFVAEMWSPPPPPLI